MLQNEKLAVIEHMRRARDVACDKNAVSHNPVDVEDAATRVAVPSKSSSSRF
jgi:hypothetical protein